MERFVRFLGEADSSTRLGEAESTSALTAQECASGTEILQIETNRTVLNNLIQMKKNLEDLERFVRFLGEADSKSASIHMSVPHGTEILQIETNQTNRYVKKE